MDMEKVMDDIIRAAHFYGHTDGTGVPLGFIDWLKKKKVEVAEEVENERG